MSDERTRLLLLRQAQERARQQLTTPAPETPAQDFRGDSKGSALGAFGREAIQGLTFGLGDELGAGASAVGDVLLRGAPSFGEAYDHRLANERGQLAQMQRENPIASTSGEMAGAVMAPLGAAGKAATVGGAALRGAAVGGATGAAYGAGNAEGGATNRAAGAASGAALGALFGAGASAATYAGSRGVQRLMKAGTDRPNLGTLRAAKDAAYKAVDDAGESFSPEDMAALRDTAAKAIAELDYVPETDAQTRAALTILDKRAEAGPQTIGQVDKVRQGLWKRYNATKEPGVLAAIDSIDEMIANRGATNDLMQTARAAHSRFKKAELLDAAFKKAADQTASTGSGGNILNKYKQVLTSILNDPKRAKWFDADEKAIMQRMVDGQVGENFLRRVGKLAPDGNGLMLALNLLGGAQFGLGSLAVTGAASAAKAVSDKGAQRAADRLMGVVAGAPQEAAAPIAIPHGINALSGYLAGR